MATRYKGYSGKALKIDLSSGSIEEYQISDNDRELFIGGKYLSTKILWDELKAGIDPLSPENLLIIMTSPLTGTGAPSSSRYDVSAKSPLTGAIGHSNSGGSFGIHLKKAGWDFLIIKGKAQNPVFIKINNENVKIENAGKLWGMDTETAQKELKKGDMAKAACLVIGPAGENLVKYACIVADERVHGRTGMGTVMGSKNLKGIVATGNHKIEVYAPEKFKKTINKWIKLLKSHPATGGQLPKTGTGTFLKLLNQKHGLPTKNFSNEGTYNDADMISGERLAEDYLVKNSGCVSCPVRCGRVVNIKGKDIKGPEYEIMSLFGSNILNNDLEAIFEWNYELDLMGIDGVSAGTTLGFAAELNERGLWKNGIEFGKKDNILEMIRKIAFKKGIGKDLAEGVKFVSEKYGGIEFAPHSKGLELPAYEPRAAVGHGLGYATASRGGCHLDGGYMVLMEVSGPATLNQFYDRSKPAWTIWLQNILGSISACGICNFTSFTTNFSIFYKLPGHHILSSIVNKLMTHTGPLVRLIVTKPGLMNFHMPFLPHSKALGEATGMKMSYGRWLNLANRGYTIEKIFNLREGINKEQDKLAKKFLSEPLVSGNKKSIVRLDKMLPKYYKIRGWDSNGIPTKKTIKKLGLGFMDINQN